MKRYAIRLRGVALFRVLTLGVMTLGVLTLHGEQTTFAEGRAFSQANARYKEGKFAQAMELYQQIPNKSALVNYNLGNTAYKLEQYGFALLYWKRAEKRWGLGSRSELIDNITLLQEKMRMLRGDEMEQRSPIALTMIKIKNLLISWTRSIPLFVLQFLFLLLWLFLFLYIRFLYKKRKKVVIGTLFGLIAFFGIILAARYNIEAQTYGIVTTGQAPLLSGPGTTYQTLMNLHQAQQVVIKKESDGYYKIRALKRTGWINKEHVGKI